MKTQPGFTLVELLMAVAVLGILLTIGVPALRDMVLNNRLVSQTNRLVSHLQLARSESIKRSAPVVLCRTDDFATPACGGTSAARTWDTGWLVYVDVLVSAAPGCTVNPNGNGVFDPNAGEIPNNGVDDDGNGCIDDTDVLLRIGEAAEGDSTIRSNAAADASLRYNPDGTADAAGRFAVCDGRGNPENFGRRVDIALTGRPSLTVGRSGSPLPANTCTNP